MPVESRSMTRHWAKVRWIGLAALAATVVASPALGQAAAAPAAAQPPKAEPGAPSTQQPQQPSATPTAAEQPSAAPAPAEAHEGTGAAASTAPSDSATASSTTSPAVASSEDPNAPAAPATGPAAAATTADAPSLEAIEEAPTDLTETEEPKINFYGFADASFSKDFKAEPIANKYSTFAVGNVNLYMASELGAQWRSLIEVRYMYLPHGQVPFAEQYTGGARVDTTTQDYQDVNRPIRWGGISIQRAWVERTFHELFTLRMGQFLSPYGIWNVDHGSPVIIGVRRPFLVGEALIPESQTGLEAYGSVYYKATQFGYHLTLTNGRGPLDTYKDLNHNKALGGRLFVRTEGDFGRLGFGISGYRGRYSDRASAMAFGRLVTSDPATSDYQELTVTTDVKWELGGALVQAEAGRNETAYGDVRPPAFGTKPGVPFGLTPDAVKQGFYVLGGYRIAALWNTMPFVGGEYMHYGQQANVPAAGSYWVGLNIRPTPRVVLKAQFSRVFFDSSPTFELVLPTFYKLETQVAWSF